MDVLYKEGALHLESAAAAQWANGYLYGICGKVQSTSGPFLYDEETQLDLIDAMRKSGLVVVLE